MTARLPVGPYREISLDDGTKAPYYIIPFDKRGISEGPETQSHLVDTVRQGTYSDVFLFSHGWNNDWTTATQSYEHFLTGYMNMRRTENLPVPPNYRPLLVGIFWPSSALVFGEDEVGPDFAAGDPAAVDQAVGEERSAVRELAQQLDTESATRFYELTQKQELPEAEALELAELAAVFYQDGDDELQETVALSAQEIVDIWLAATEPKPDLGDFGTVGGGAGGPQAAGLGALLDPRQVIRLLTVYQMKDRAGTVGAHGVGLLLRDLLQANDARVHLIGHSYGAKVVLSAVSFGGDLPRNVESMLLLQPAVSHLCFANQVPGTQQPGGYRSALARVNKPILSTFSRNDFPLHNFFHLAVRRKVDLGEALIAGPDEPPNRFAALGGYGPRQCGEELIDILDVNQPYQLDLQKPIYGIRGTRTIKGHSDISNPSTWWALYNLITS